MHDGHDRFQDDIERSRFAPPDKPSSELAAGDANEFIGMQAARRLARWIRQSADESRVVSIGTVFSAT
jgi:hypothetical protein